MGLIKVTYYRKDEPDIIKSAIVEEEQIEDIKRNSPQISFMTKSPVENKTLE